MNDLHSCWIFSHVISFVLVILSIFFVSLVPSLFHFYSFLCYIWLFYFAFFYPRLFQFLFDFRYCLFFWFFALKSWSFYIFTFRLGFLDFFFVRFACQCFFLFEYFRIFLFIPIFFLWIYLKFLSFIYFRFSFPCPLNLFTSSAFSYLFFFFFSDWKCFWILKILLVCNYYFTIMLVVLSTPAKMMTEKSFSVLTEMQFSWEFIGIFPRFCVPLYWFSRPLFCPQ